ncbi:bacteriohemerythrin [Alkalispirochaeta alkalica]|uniref:bacteriohemerythrin n=1 Tax=Alkalispirochaeta alkalica TaxID=46356 RepID=UPI00036564CF|nr:bacteriohemerythrin [Alkalispirochaeta alkalica]
MKKPRLKNLLATALPAGAGMLAVLSLIFREILQPQAPAGPLFWGTQALLVGSIIVLAITGARRGTSQSLRAALERFASGHIFDDLTHDEPNPAPDGRGDPLEALLGRGFSALRELIREVHESAQGSEKVGRRLAREVAETLFLIGQIAGESAETARLARNLSTQVDRGASTVEEIQQELAALVTRIASQRGLVEQSATAVAQMSASIESVASVTESKRSSAEGLLDLASQGRSQVSTTEGVIGKVGSSVQSVNTMVNVINEIAARTNLLAMNAAIEAAHAGSFGRGFAVVAAEIRNLAESTAHNAKQISQTLKELVDNIDQAQVASQHTARSFGDIEEGVHSVVEAFQEIAAATRELSQGTGEVVSATTSLREITTGISSSADDMKNGTATVTELLASTRQAARETTEAMDSIGTSLTALSGGTTELTRLGAENNSQVIHLFRTLRNTQEQDSTREDDRFQTGLSIQRLETANLMLDHVRWLTEIRSVLDARDPVSPALEIPDTALTQWLQVEGKTRTGDPQTYRRLTETHRKTRDLSRELPALYRENPAAAEEQFQELLAESRTILEILTTLQEGSTPTWTPGLSVKVDIFDEHHKRWLAIIDQLYRVLRDGSSDEVLEKTFDDVIAYTDYHLGAEEAAFEHFGYPQCQNHKEMHQKLAKKIHALHREMQEGNKKMVALEVMDFLEDWVVKHIVKCDKLYAPFFQNLEVAQFLRDRKF